MVFIRCAYRRRINLHRYEHRYFLVGGSGGRLSVLFKLTTLIPGLALGARRLHDINKRAWWLLMWLIVWLVIPMILLLVWVARQGDNGPNKYGLDLRNHP